MNKCAATLGELCPELALMSEELEMVMIDMGIVEPKVGDILYRPQTAEEKAKVARKAETYRLEMAAKEQKASDKAAKRQTWMALKAEKKAKAKADEEARAKARAKKQAEREAKALRVKALAEEAKRRHALENPNKGDAAVSALTFMQIPDMSIRDIYVRMVRNKSELAEIKYAGYKLWENRSELLADIGKLQKAVDNQGEVVDKLITAYEEFDLGRPEKAEKELDKLTAELESAKTVLVEMNRVREMQKLRKFELMDELKALREFVSHLYKSGNGITKGEIDALESKCRMKRHIAKDVRQAAKVLEKVSAPSIRVRTFNPGTVNSEYAPLQARFEQWTPKFLPTEPGQKKELTAASQAGLDEARKGVAAFDKYLDDNQDTPIVLSLKDSRVTHLPETMITMGIGIPSDTPEVTSLIAVVDHMSEDMVGGNWRVWGDTPKEAEAHKAEVVQKMYNRICRGGFTIGKNGYGKLYASPSHQKKEKIVICENGYLKEHEEYLHFGKTKDQFIATQKLVGPEYWKAMANLGRPIAAVMKTKDGREVEPKDCLVVSDVKRIYHHGRALKIGGSYQKVDNNGEKFFSPYMHCEADNPVICGDGQMIALTELELCGQTSAWGLKGISHNSQSVIEYFCKKYGLTIEEFYNLEVERYDGTKKRLGDYILIFGDGCWKFDKFFKDWDEYLETIERMKEKYPNIGKITILRQLDDEEGELKIRRLTRSLIQQWLDMTDDEVDQMVDPAVKNLKNQMKFETAYRALAQLYKDDRTDTAKFFEAAPWMVLAPNVQKYWQKKWDKMVIEAMSNRFRTKGQYPYIIQDPVALLELWVLKKDPQSPDLGVVKAGEVSLDSVEKGKKVAAVRFPANFLTAKVLVCNPYKDVYESCGNCAVLSIYDDILIVQDGDVDGDEMCIIYEPLAVMLTERMNETFKPPVVVFDHGTKAVATELKDERDLDLRLAKALFSASHNDKVGIFANLARDCAYLARIALVENDTELMKKYILWMAAASTGAILAIDQVKGNDISASLIEWLENISFSVKEEMSRLHPWTQMFLKGLEPDKVREPDRRVHTDLAALRVQERVGEYKFDGQGLVWNMEAALDALGENRWQHFKVRNCVMPTEVKEKLRMNFYNDYKDANGNDPDADFNMKLRDGLEVTAKSFLVWLWHNEIAMISKIEGKLLGNKRDEYYKLCWWALKQFATSNKKPNKDGHVRTKAEELTSLYWMMLNEILEFACGNGIDEDQKGNYVMFCIRVLSSAMTNVVKNNGWTPAAFAAGSDFEQTGEQFCDEEESYDDLMADIAEEVSYDDIWFGKEDDEDMELPNDGFYFGEGWEDIPA